MASVKDELRDLYDFIHFAKVNKSYLTKKAPAVIRRIREQIADLQNQLTDVLEKPITEEWRHIYRDEMGESGYYYAILPDEGETDDELSEWFDRCVAYPPICGPFDCTGKRFTWLKHIKRTKAGIVVVHGWSLDI